MLTIIIVPLAKVTFFNSVIATIAMLKLTLKA